MKWALLIKMNGKDVLVGVTNTKEEAEALLYDYIDSIREDAAHDDLVVGADTVRPATPEEVIADQERTLT